MRALRELEVRSPLRECGLTKADIRRLSREAGLFTWDKPAYACLATRLPTGDALTEDLLARVEGAEDALFRLGYADFRVRVFHGAAAPASGRAAGAGRPGAGRPADGSGPLFQADSAGFGGALNGTESD